MQNKTLWIRFCPFDLTADRFWRQASCTERGLYWSLITDLYTEGGAIPYDPAAIKCCVNWDDQRDGDFETALKRLLDAKFKVSRNMITHKRVTIELERAEKLSKLQSEKGRLGGRPKLSPQDDQKQESYGKATALQRLSYGKAIDETRREKIDREERNEPLSNIANSTGQIAFFRFVEAVQGELKVHSQADMATIRNIALHLSETNPDSYSEVIDIARQCITARKPIAVFCKRIKTEYHWNPRSKTGC